MAKNTSSTNPATPDQQTFDFSGVPDEYTVPADYSNVVDATATHLNTGGETFLSGGPGEGQPWYEKHLEGKPFVITSALDWRRVDTRFNKDVEQVVARIRFIENAEGKPSESSYVAVFQGRYLLNQLRKLRSFEIQSLVWTVARNTTMPMTPSGSHPYMLAVYDVRQMSDEGGEW